MNEDEKKEVIRKYFEECEIRACCLDEKVKTKLDIGSSEGAYDPEDDSWLRIDINKAEERMEGKVDLIVDAHDLSCFEDESFDVVWSGACLVCYTRDEAVKEAARVLKEDGKMLLRIQTLYLGRLIRCLYENNMYVEGIEELNYGGTTDDMNELIEVIVTARRGRSEWKDKNDEPHLYEDL